VVRPIEYWLKAEDPDELAEGPECLPWANYRSAIGLVVEWIKWYAEAHPERNQL
jgi:hypothetical protein